MSHWLVTGAARGIGLGIVTLLAKRNTPVVAAARDPDAPALRALAAAHPGIVSRVAMDVTDGASVASAAAACAGTRLSVLVNNAGVYGPKRQGALDVELDGFLETLAVNTVAPFRVLQAFRPLLESGAKVATISSTMGSITGASAGYVAYRASKAAVNKAVQASAGELAGHGIVSVVMHPGWVRTDMGGPNADISVDESAAGIVATIDRLTRADAGRFLNWNGTPAAW